LASKGREVGLYDFTIYEVIRRNSRCCKERPACSGVSDGRIERLARSGIFPFLMRMAYQIGERPRGCMGRNRETLN
jgi:hypothetical protein